MRRLVLGRAMGVAATGAAVGCVAGLGIAAAQGIAGHVGAALAVAFALGMGVTLAATITTRRVIAPAAQRPIGGWLGIVMLAAGALTVVGNLSNMEGFAGILGVLLLWLGLILAAPLLALIVLWPMAWILGIYGGKKARLASRDAMRQPHRAAALASALITGVALVVVFAAVGTLLGLVVLVAAFDIGRTLARSGLERRQEIRLLCAVGATRPYIWRAVRQGSALIAICGGGLGLAFGTLVGGAVQHVLHAQPLRDLAMPLPTVAAMLAVLAGAGAVAIWWPVARAIQPSQS